jgi:hypothetical protein
MNKQKWKSVGAVFAGLLFIIIVTTLVDVLLHVAHVYPEMGVRMTNGLALLASSYRLVISIAGAYLTAKLSPGQPMRDVIVLGCVGTVLGILGVVQSWDLDLGPRWYAISLAVLAIPQCWFGGRLFVRRHPGAAAPVPVAS